MIDVNQEASAANNELKQLRKDVKQKTDLAKQLEILADQKDKEV